MAILWYAITAILSCYSQTSENRRSRTDTWVGHFDFVKTEFILISEFYGNINHTYYRYYSSHFLWNSNVFRFEIFAQNGESEILWIKGWILNKSIDLVSLQSSLSLFHPHDCCIFLEAFLSFPRASNIWFHRFFSK